MNGDWNDALEGLQAACLETFGTPVIYHLVSPDRDLTGQAPVNLTGVFDAHRVEISIMEHGGMDAVVPKQVLEFKIADLGGPEPMIGDEVTINGTFYRVLDVRPTQGWAVLHLGQMNDPVLV
ncbi:MAG: hypothetical protein HQL84_16060 [Magnetococcales bacterium]|nr:hypothetical protein [Magnetococcales bacterium]MBF0151535.1 hypothetical protein [Magnetococcales bacterium]